MYIYYVNKYDIKINKNQKGCRKDLIITMAQNELDLDEKETINVTTYLQFLKNLWRKWHRNRRHMTQLLDDNARPHRNASVKAWIEEKEICHWLQPAYSPDLSPCDYGCYHSLKKALSGVQYTSIAELKAAVDKEIINGNKNGKYLAVLKLPDRWEKCIKTKDNIFNVPQNCVVF